MSTTLTIDPHGAVRLSQYPGETPTLLHPDGSPSFVACYALAKRRHAASPYARFDLLLDQACVEADMQVARFGKSADELELLDLKDRLARPISTDPHQARFEREERARLRALVAPVEARIAARDVILAKAA